MPHFSKKMMGSCIGLTTLTIVGCAALTPTWEILVDEATPTSSHLYAHTDGNSFYKVSNVSNTTTATVQHLDMEGGVLNESQVPLRYLSNRNLTTYSSEDSNQFMIVMDNLSHVLVYDPESESVVTRPNLDFLEENQRVSLRSHVVVNGDSLLFSGRLVNTDDTSDSVVIWGFMESDGTISQFNVVPDAITIEVFAIPNTENHLMVGQFSNDYIEQTGRQSFIRTLSASYEELTYAELNESVHVRQLAEDRFIGYLRPAPREYIDGIFTFTGEQIASITQTFEERRKRPSNLVSENHYYRVETIYEELFNFGDGAIQFNETKLSICQYNYDFEVNWCTKSSAADNFYEIKAAIVNGDELGVSFSSTHRELTNFDISLLGNDLTFLADLDLRGKAQSEAHHWLFTENGDRKLDIMESPYYHTGPARFDVKWNLLITAENRNPGVTAPLSSLFLPGPKAVTYSRYSNGNSLTNTKLTLWEK